MAKYVVAASRSRSCRFRGSCHPCHVRRIVGSGHCSGGPAGGAESGGEGDGGTGHVEAEGTQVGGQ
ncbi:MAG: hypothetical protein ACT4OS_04020, partial [Acidimicrobiales bacterium]